MNQEFEQLMRQIDHIRPPYARRHQAEPPPNPSEESERQLKRIADQLKANAEQAKSNITGLAWLIAIGFLLILLALNN